MVRKDNTDLEYIGPMKQVWIVLDSQRNTTLKENRWYYPFDHVSRPAGFDHDYEPSKGDFFRGFVPDDWIKILSSASYRLAFQWDKDEKKKWSHKKYIKTLDKMLCTHRM